METIRNSVLVISEGPPPLGDTIAEGGALRAWGLAKGLAGHGHKVTFAYRASYRIDSKQTHGVQKGIKVTTWSPDSVGNLVSKHRVLVMRYAMGEAQLFISHLKAEHILVSDSYIPISVEVSARNSSDTDELINYLRLQKSCLETTLRGDYFLYASPAQLTYYLGYFSGINKLNPITYKQLEKRLFEVPYGIDSGTKPSFKVPPKDPTLLWYGAFYSWFDMESLIPSLIKLKKKNPRFKMLIAGAKNPYNKDPGLLAHYDKTMKALAPLQDSVEFLPWTPYDERFSIYEKASAIITYNHEGLENLLAWRTRLMDFILADRPILTNGGDPLGEDLIDRGIARRINGDNLESVFLEAIANPPSDTIFENTRSRYDWMNITKELAEALYQAKRLTPTQVAIHLSLVGKIRSVARSVPYLPVRVVKYARSNGLEQTFRRIFGK